MSFEDTHWHLKESVVIEKKYLHMRIEVADESGVCSSTYTW